MCREANELVDRGVAYQVAGRLEEAIREYRGAIELDSRNLKAWNNLGTTFLSTGRNPEAVDCFERTTCLAPDNASVFYNLGCALEGCGRIEEAAGRFRQALSLMPEHGPAHNNLGNLAFAKGDLEMAILHYRRAIDIDPGNMPARNNLGNALRDKGKLGEALIQYERAIAIDPANPIAHFNRAEIAKFRKGGVDLAALELLASEDSLKANQTPYVHFALGKAFDDVGEYERAFASLRKGNELRRAQVAYDEVREARRFDEIAAAFDRRTLARWDGAGDPSQVPVFIIGMPRSGGTMIEQILTCHPLIDGMGETGFFQSSCDPLVRGEIGEEALRKAGAAYVDALPKTKGRVRVVDKLGDNFLRAGLIRMALPNAKIIHSVRHPADACVSCYSKLFTTGQHFSYELGELGRYYARYARLMDHWRAVLPKGSMLEVRYEDVVADLEGQSRRMIEFCGIEWNDACINFHRNKRSVRTASSVQVRRPLFRSSLNRWRNYEPWIGALLEELRGVMPGRPRRDRRAAA